MIFILLFFLPLQKKHHDSIINIIRRIAPFVNPPNTEKIADQGEENIHPIHGRKEKIFQEAAGGVGAKAIKGLQ
jgi:hypothetical protein